MPTNRFKNIDDQKCADLENLAEQLFKNALNISALEPIFEHIARAHMCSMVEAAINSFEIQRLVQLDPVQLKQVNDALDACR